jgi:hypothetical protein
VIAGYRGSYKLLLAGYFAARLGGLIPILLGAGAEVRSSPLFFGLFLTGTALLFAGCWALARAKGYSGWFALAAAAGLLGLIVLAVLPDRAPAGAEPGTVPDSDGTADGAESRD